MHSLLILLLVCLLLHLEGRRTTLLVLPYDCYYNSTRLFLSSASSLHRVTIEAPKRKTIPPHPPALLPGMESSSSSHPSSHGTKTSVYKEKIISSSATSSFIPPTSLLFSSDSTGTHDKNDEESIHLDFFLLDSS